MMLKIFIMMHEDKKILTFLIVIKFHSYCFYCNFIK